MIPLAKPLITKEDEQAVLAALRNDQLSGGPYCSRVESQFCELTSRRFAASVSSGTAALILAYQALGIKKGDEVITSAFSVPATLNAIVQVGAKPVFADIDQNLGLDLEDVKSKISQKTKAVCAVHVLGRMSSIIELELFCRESGLFLVEDACEALGASAQGRAAGSFGDISVFGFYPNKHVTAGEGGMLVTNSQMINEKVSSLRNQGRQNGPWFDQNSFGWNFRLSDINGALLSSQLNRLDQIRHRRHQLYQFYSAQLDPLEMVEMPVGSHPFVANVLVDQRDQVFEAMNRLGVQCGRYFAPLHQQPIFKQTFKKVNLPNCEQLSKRCLSLPFFLELTKDQQTEVIKKLKSVTQV